MPSSESSSSQNPTQEQPVTEKEQKRQHKTIPPWLSAAVWTLRILVGGVFVYSGFVKAIDLWGFIFKFEDYLAILDLTAPRSVSLTLTLALSSCEFVCGFLLLTGAYKRWSVWIISAMMAVMLPLTFILWIADPIDDCGCFGDAFVISNGMTFLKNVIIAAACLFLIKYNRRVSSSLFHPEAQWLELIAATIYIVVIGLMCYNVQPFIDFRPYPAGQSLVGDADNAPEPLFRYTDGNVTRDFPADSIPADSTWQFVKRVMPAGYNDSGNMFTIYDGDEDVTADVILSDTPQLLLVIPETERADISSSYFINELYRLSSKHGIDFIGLLATGPEGIEEWRDLSLADYECYTVEDTSLKELARGRLSIVYLEEGIIRWKRTVSALDDVDNLTYLEQKYSDRFAAMLVPQTDSEILLSISRDFGIALLILWIIQALVSLIYRKSGKKDSK